MLNKRTHKKQLYRGERSLLFRHLSLRYRFFSPFHLVTMSPWPIIFSFAVLLFIFGVAAYLHTFYFYRVFLKIGFFAFFWCFLRWIRDVVYEGFIQGCHTDAVQRGLRIGFILFIFSEIMFFSAFFWAFFHSSLAPSLEVGCAWPPVQGLRAMFSGFSIALYAIVMGIEPFNPWFVPFLNTLLLLTSGVWLTFSHAEIQCAPLEWGAPFLFRKAAAASPIGRCLLPPTGEGNYTKKIDFFDFFFTRIYFFIAFFFYTSRLLVRFLSESRSFRSQ